MLWQEKTAVESVDYSLDNPNRCTINFVRGATNNAERIEMFSNKRESELRATDNTFFSLENLRQVTLGYSSQYGKHVPLLLLSAVTYFNLLHIYMPQFLP